METPTCAKTNPRPLLFEHDIVVRTYDIDYAGHVSNIVYLRWLEDMRNMLFDIHFPIEMFMKDGIGPVLASTKIEYKRAIRLFDKPHAYMWVSHLGNTSMTIDAEIMLGDKLATKASHVGVMVNMQTGKPVRLPAILKEKYEQSLLKA